MQPRTERPIAARHIGFSLVWRAAENIMVILLIKMLIFCCCLLKAQCCLTWPKLDWFEFANLLWSLHNLSMFRFRSVQNLSMFTFWSLRNLSMFRLMSKLLPQNCSFTVQIQISIDPIGKKTIWPKTIGGTLQQDFAIIAFKSWKYHKFYDDK